MSFQIWEKVHFDTNDGKIWSEIEKGLTKKRNKDGWKIGRNY